jgi:hypothetical protein
MPKVLKEIPNLHFAVPLALGVNPSGDQTISFQSVEGKKIQMQLTLTFQVTGDGEVFRGIINETGVKIPITPEMGDLFIAPIDKTDEEGEKVSHIIDFPDDFHFSYTESNMYVNLRIPIPPGSKGDHSN